jgi:hypothetical protein
MGEEKKYGAFPLPRMQPKEAAARPAAGKPNESGEEFALVDIEGPAEAAQGVPLPQKIAKREPDPVRARFIAMRRMAGGDSPLRGEERLFCRQAKFMEGFEDSWEGSAPFEMRCPTYQAMGYEQLRAYFTWRAKARKGEMPPASASYAYLYAYETLSLCGVQGPEGALKELLRVWDAFRGVEGLERHMAAWTKDFHIYYGAGRPFADFAIERGIASLYPENFLSDLSDPLQTWNSLGKGSYDVEKSQFFAQGNRQRMGECFASVLKGLMALCREKGMALESLALYTLRKDVDWKPFARAVFCPKGQEGPDREVFLPGGEAYRLEGGQWKADILLPYAGQKELCGHITKKTEECLRKACGHKRKITASTSGLSQAREKYRGMGLALEEMDRAIEQAVQGYWAGLGRIVVTLDEERLERIRRDALSTQGKLAVPDEGNAASAPLPAPCAFSPSKEGPRDAWADFRSALAPLELGALEAAFGGEEAFCAYAQEAGALMEALADAINEKAADFVGDSVLQVGEGGARIYGEYAESIQRIMGV